MPHPRHSLLLSFLFLTVFASPGLAQVRVDDVQKYFKADRAPVQNVMVTNDSENDVYGIKVKVMKIVDPSNVDEKHIISEDLIIAPQKFALRPGEKRQVRIMLAEPMNDTERMYRVHFMPTVINPDDQGNTPDKVQAGVKIVSVMGLLTVVSPLNPEPNLTWERDHAGITFKNEGNVSVDLRSRNNYCFDQAETDCISLPAKRIHPGSTWRLDGIDGDKKLQYYYHVYREPGSVIVEPIY